MHSRPAGSSDLQIERFQVEYLVPRDHPSPERLRGRLDKTLGHSVPESLEHALTPYFGQSGEDVWLIRKLECDLDLDVDNDPDLVARRWGTGIARVLVRVLEGAATEGVLHFPSWAAYLGRFLLDLVAGSAWRQWYYNEFRGLKALPISAAIRTAVLDEPDTGAVALTSLEARERYSVLSALTAIEARRVLDGLAAAAAPAGEEPERNALVALLAARSAQRETARVGREPWVAALDLYLRVVAREPHQGGRRLMGLCHALALLDDRLVDLSETRRLALLDAIEGGNTAALFQLVGPGDGEHLATLLRCPESQRRGLVRELLAELQGGGGATAEPAPTPETEGTRHTAFGGAFLLLPLLERVPVEEGAATWPEPEGADKTALLRLLILATCMGGDRVVRVFNDPLLRDLLQVPPSVSVEDVAGWLSGVTPAQQQAFLARLAHWRLQEDPDQVLVGTTRRNCAELSVLMARRKGFWLAALACDTPPGGATLAEALDAFVATGTPVGGPMDPAADGASQVPGLQRLEKDLDFLGLPRSLCPDPDVHLALCIAAQGVLRDFGYRLPGFASSSLGHLYANFLDIGASVERQPERWVVRLGRPPLDVILNMTGMARASYSLSWLRGPPFALFPEG